MFPVCYLTKETDRISQYTRIWVDDDGKEVPGVQILVLIRENSEVGQERQNCTRSY